MANGPSLPGQKALAEALDKFKGSTSPTHSAIYQSLTKLDLKHRRLSVCFTKRATDSEEAQGRSAIESQQKAETALQKAKVDADKEVAARGKLSVEAQQNVTFYEQQIENSILM